MVLSPTYQVALPPLHTLSRLVLNTLAGGALLAARRAVSLEVAAWGISTRYLGREAKFVAAHKSQVAAYCLIFPEQLRSSCG